MRNEGSRCKIVETALVFIALYNPENGNYALESEGER